MKVILDTNIIFDNYYLNTPKFMGLFRYSKKTRSKIIISDYILKEIYKKYNEELNKGSKENKKFNRIFLNNNDEIDISLVEKNYHSYLEKLISDKKISIYHSKLISSRKIFDRALLLLKPFKPSGDGVRDTLIWLSIVDLIKNNPKEYFCFITNNTKDFGEKVLFPQLIKDLGINSSRLFYFNTLQEFLSEYGDKIEFIDEMLFMEFFNDQHDKLLSYVDLERISEGRIDDVPRSYYIEKVDNISIGSIEINDFYIYSSNESFYKVQIEIVLNLELDFLLENSMSNYEDDEDNRLLQSGSSWCILAISVSVDKKTKEIIIDSDIADDVYYA